MKLNIGKKELKIKFAYEPTVKAHIISKMIKIGDEFQGFDKDPSKIEDFLGFLPEILLVGLQKFHKDEFGYDYDSEEEKEQKKSEVFELLDDYFDGDDADIMKLFNDLQEEMLKNGFLAKMFQQEQEKAEREGKEEAEKAESGS